MSTATKVEKGGLDALANLKTPKPGEPFGQFIVKDNYSLAPKMHEGGRVPKDGIYTLQEGEVVIPKFDKLSKSPRIKVTVPKHNDLADSADDVRNQRATGEVESGGSMDGVHSPVQPEPAREGATPVRIRKSESTVTEGHHITSPSGPEPYKHDTIGLGRNLAKHDADETHVHAPVPEAKTREEYVASERERKEEKTASPSRRVSLKDMVAKSKGV